MHDCLIAAVVAQAAFAVEQNPAKPGFWSQVARKVPGKSAQQCLDHHFASHPTPPASKAKKPGKLAKYLQPAGPAPAFAGAIRALLVHTLWS